MKLSFKGNQPSKAATMGSGELLREDAGFHAYQMLEAGVRQFSVRWRATRRAGMEFCDCRPIERAGRGGPSTLQGRTKCWLIRSGGSSGCGRP